MSAVGIFLVVALLWALDSRRRWKKLALQEKRLLEDYQRFSRKQLLGLRDVNSRLAQIKVPKVPPPRSGTAS